ncbi:12273_t:CDS:2, partial [Acaulospora colombiana]
QLSSSLGCEVTFKPISDFFDYLAEDFKKQASLIDQVFPPESDVFYVFVERVVEDVVSGFRLDLTNQARSRDIMIYLKAVGVACLHCKRIAEVLWKHAKPGLSKIRAEEVIYRMFEPMMNQYLNDELTMVKVLNEEEIDKWNQKVLNKTILDQRSFLNNSNREVYKRNYLSSFRKVLKLDKRSSVTSIQGFDGSSSPTDQMTSSNARSGSLQQLLSLETALQMIHANKDSLHRISAFIGFPGEMGQRMYIETIEMVFISLLRTLGTKHIKPGFGIAVQRLNDQADLKGLAPLVEFFELTHIADLIQQMVQVYYDEEMSRFIDRMDFLNICNKEKKIFEKTLDECVAAGLNKGIQILIDRIEFILATEQRPGDFEPPADASLDLAPTKLGNIYIISNPRDIGLFIRETERFNGIFYAEDIYEFCQRRDDWMMIKKAVDKELYGLKAED